MLLVKLFEHDVEGATVYEYSDEFSLRYDYTLTVDGATLMVSQEFNLSNSLEACSLNLIMKNVEVQVHYNGDMIKAYVGQITKFSMGNAQQGSTQLNEKITLKVIQEL